MESDLLNALRRKLVAYEGAGMDDLAKRVKARITVEEKAAAKADKKTEAEATEPEPETTSKASKKET